MVNLSTYPSQCNAGILRLAQSPLRIYSAKCLILRPVKSRVSLAHKQKISGRLQKSCMGRRSYLVGYVPRRPVGRNLGTP